MTYISAESARLAWLRMADLGEVLLQQVERVRLGAAAQHLGDEGAAGLQDLARKVMSGFGPGTVDAQMVDLRFAG